MPRKDAKARKEYQARYYRENRERLDEAHKKWREDNPEKIKDINTKASKRYRDSMQKKLKVIQPDVTVALKDIGLNDK